MTGYGDGWIHLCSRRSKYMISFRSWGSFSLQPVTQGPWKFPNRSVVQLVAGCWKTQNEKSLETSWVSSGCPMFLVIDPHWFDRF